MKKVSYFLATLFLASCHQQQTTSEVKIAGGAKVPNLQDPIAKSTVSFVDGNGESFCSGTLISPTKVLTAAHCIATFKTKLPIKAAFGLQVQAVKGVKPTEPPRFLDIENVVSHFDYRVGDFAPYFPSYKPRDVAIVQLKESAPSYTRPVPIISSSMAFQQQKVILAGYGYTSEPDLETNSDDMGIMRYIRVFTSGAGEWEQHSGLLEYYGPKGIGACSGDSGGPMFYEKEGKLYLIGATMGGTACGVENLSNDGYYTSLFPLRDWITCAAGVDVDKATDTQKGLSLSGCNIQSKQVCQEMVFKPKDEFSYAITYSAGRGGNRFKAEDSELLSGDVAKVTRAMGEWAQITLNNQILFVPTDEMQCKAGSKVIQTGTIVKTSATTYLKMFAGNSTEHNDYQKCLLAKGTVLELLTYRAPTFPEFKHHSVALKKKIPGCNLTTGFIFSNHLTKDGLAMP